MNKLSTLTIFILLLLINNLTWADGFFESIFGSDTQQKEGNIDPQPEPVMNDSPETDRAALPINQDIPKKTSTDKSNEIAPKIIPPAEKQPPKQIIDSEQTKPVEPNSAATDKIRKIPNKTIKVVPKTTQKTEKQLPKQITDSEQTKPVEPNSASTDKIRKISNKTIIVAPKTTQKTEKQLPKQITDSEQTKAVDSDSAATNKNQPNVNEAPVNIDKQSTQTKPAEITYSNNEEKGLAIIMEVDRRDTGWQDSQSTLKMILKNRHGDEHTRHLKMKTMEVQSDGDKSLSIFNSPKDIKGTAFLSFTHALDPDEQWLYLPAVKRVKRISSRNKSGPYLGSEFSFEDLSSFEVKKYKYKYLRDEVLGGINCFVIETAPQYKHSGYTRTILWIDKQRYILLKVDYYDRKNSLLKTQTFHEYNQYLKQYWRPDEMRMVNHTNGKSTSLLMENYQFRKGLTKRSFDKNALKRAR